ncbi:MAG TPA: hypothetical protein ENL04_00050 [Sulfuricurvum sp.]|nr:hypothetical protein [Sulfuricurvum sp.]
MNKQLIWLIVWGITFGYMEAAVVVYLREIYYPDGFAFPLKLISGAIMWTEIGREAATLVIMAATVMLAYERMQSRMAAFAVLFGVWDIFYYVFLRLILDWPKSLATWDILFLIPAPWVGPVWAPVLVSVGLIGAGSVVLSRNADGRYPRFGKRFVLAETAAGMMIVSSFLISGRSIIGTGMPEAFVWSLFMGGFVLGAGVFFYSVKR